MRIRLLLVVFLAAARLAAQDISTAIVPVAGSVFGPTMVRWKTAVEVVNDTGRPVVIAMEMPFAPALAEMATELGPGQSMTFPDIASAFSLDQVLSPLVVRTIGRRSVTVRASAYAVRPDGELSPMQPLSVFIGPSFHPLRILDGLAFSEDFRTNIGVVNFGERDAEIVLALQRIPGRPIAVTPLVVPRGTMLHTSIQSLFPLITQGSGFSVVVETTATDTYVYASVIESVNHAGRFVAPRIGSR